MASPLSIEPDIVISSLYNYHGLTTILANYIYKHRSGKYMYAKMQNSNMPVRQSFLIWAMWDPRVSVKQKYL